MYLYMYSMHIYLYMIVSLYLPARAVLANASRPPLAIGRDQWASTTPIHKSRRFRGGRRWGRAACAAVSLVSLPLRLAARG